MESINARAIYLKNHCKLHPLRPNNHQKHDRMPNSPTRLKTEHYITHRKTDKSKNLKNYCSLQENTAFNFSTCITNSANSVALKEKNILLKIAELKSKRNTKIKKETLYSHMWVTKCSHKDVQRLQLSLTKPTDQLFHHLNNVRLAERLLFAKSTREISNSSQKQFYKEQTRYKLNISRMPSTLLKQRPRRKSLKPWQD